MENQMNEKPVRPVFKTEAVEKISVVLMLVFSYIYNSYLLPDEFEGGKIFLLIFIVGFIGITELLYFHRKRTVESWIFLGFTVLLTVSRFTGLNSVWEDGTMEFFIHLFAMYYVLVRSGRLAEGKTGSLFIWDGITAFFVMPFKNFPLAPKTIGSIFKNGNQEKKKNGARIAITILASVIGLILLIIAVSNLMKADPSYKAMMDKVLSVFKFEWNVEIIFRLIFAIPVGFYLYGYLGGCYRETEAQVQHRGDNIKKFIGMLRKVPNVVWMIFVGAASLFYIIFYGFQGSYLWGAFTQTLPEGFVYSSYAREGFFNMCAVMAINLTLDWLLSRTSEKDHPSILGGRILLCVESVLFSVVALLKLAMYIDAYGFTPLRFQSLWLIVVLLFGCILTLVSAVTKKKTARIWFIGSAGLLVLFAFLFPNWAEGMVKVYGGWF